MLYLLFFIVILLFIATFFMSKGDLLSPAVLFCMIFLICISFALINIKAWNIDYHPETFGIMMAGIGSFVLVSIPFYIIEANTDVGRAPIKREYHAIIPDKKIIWLFVIADVVITIIYMREVTRISMLGGNNMGLAGASFYYRNYTSMNSDAENVSTLLNQFLKLSRALGFVSIFLLAYNSQSLEKNRGCYSLSILVTFSMIQSLIGGGRGLLLWYAGMAFSSFYIITMAKYGWKKRISFRYIIIGLVTLCAVLIVFYLLKYWIRIGNDVNSSIDYISYYAGGPIQNFNLYIENPPSGTHQLWGQETFIGIHSTLSTFGLEQGYNLVYSMNSNLEYRWSGLVALGNVYGAIRRYYNDFGVLGVIVLQAIASVFYNAYYYKIKHMSYSNKRINLWVILLYCVLTYHLFEFPIDDNLYKSFISFNMFTTFIVIYVIYYIFIKSRWNLRGRKESNQHQPVDITRTAPVSGRSMLSQCAPRCLASCGLFLEEGESVSPRVLIPFDFRRAFSGSAASRSYWGLRLASYYYPKPLLVQWLSRFDIARQNGLSLGVTRCLE